MVIDYYVFIIGLNVMFQLLIRLPLPQWPIVAHGAGRQKCYMNNKLIFNIYPTYIWVNYNDLTATSLESWLVREIIPTWP